MVSMALARAVVAAALAMLAGCSALLDLHDPALQSAVDGDVVDSPGPHDAPLIDMPPAGYHAAAVRFDPAGGDYLSQGGLLGAPASSQVGTFSMWLHFNGGDGSAQTVAAAMEIASGGVVRNASNKIQFILYQCNGAGLLNMQSVSTITSTSGWTHVLAAWDLANNKAQIYINGVLDTATNPTVKGGSICYNAPTWYIGGGTGGSLDADVADFFASFDTFLDLGSPSNVARFRDQAGKPVDLGPGCSTAAGGTSPIACFIGPVAGWSTNKGTGGGFTLHGDGLAAAPTSP